MLPQSRDAYVQKQQRLGQKPIESELRASTTSEIHDDIPSRCLSKCANESLDRRLHLPELAL